MVISALQENSLPLEKCLIVAQDAIGAHLWGSHENELSKILPLVPMRVPLRAVFPPITPTPQLKIPLRIADGQNTP